LQDAGVKAGAFADGLLVSGIKLRGVPRESRITDD